MSRDHDRRDYERDRVVYERDRDRRGDERVRYEEDDEYLAYDNNRRPAPAPTRVRERSPTPPGRRGDERFIQRERRFVHDDDNDNDSLILPASARRRAPPPAVIPDDFDDRRPGGGGSRVTVDRERVRIREGDDSIIGSSAGGPPPPRPGRLIRRQSSVETFDRRPARRAYDLDRVEGGRPPVNVPIPLPIRRRRDSSAERREHEYERERDRYIERERERERGRDRERERDRTEIEEIRIEPGRIEVDDVEIDRRRRRESFERHERDRHERERDRIVETERIEKSTFREDERRGRPVVYDQEVDKRVVHDYRRSESEMVVGRSPSVSSEGSITSVRTGRSSGGITLRSEQGASKSIGKSEYPKKGKTRMPARLVSEQVLIDLHYPFIREGNTLVLQVALGQDNIDDVLKLSRDYKKNETDIIETKTTKVKTSGGTVIEEERRREEVFTTPSRNQPPPVQHYQPPPVPPPPPQMYQPQQVYYTAPPPAQYEYAPVVVPAPDPVERSPAYSTTNIHIRDASPARSYTTTMPSMNETSVALVRTARSRSRGPPPGMSMALAPVIYDVGSPAVEVAEEPLAVAVVDNRRRSKSRHRHRHSHSTHRRARSHSHGGDGALFAHFHDRRDRDDRYYDVTVDDRYYREERDYHDAPSSGRELVRAERLSTGELVLYQEQVERVEEPRYGVRIEKDKKGRMAISVPKYR